MWIVAEDPIVAHALMRLLPHQDIGAAWCGSRADLERRIEIQGAEASPPRVLLVDEPMWSNVQEMLSRQRTEGGGFEPVCVILTLDREDRLSGAPAAIFLRKPVTPGNLMDPCNLVLLDIMMPGMDGYEVCQKIRSDERIRDLPIILLTAKKDIESKVRGLDIGANDYVTKPFDRQEILARIRSLLTIEELKGKLVSAERLAAVGSMVVTLNHEINNPLAAIAGNAELLEMTLKDAPEDVREKLRVIQDQCMRIKDILIRIRNLKEANPKAYLQNTDMIDLEVESDEDGGDGANVIS